MAVCHPGGGFTGRLRLARGVVALFAALALLGGVSCYDIIRKTDRVAKVPPPYSPLFSGHKDADEKEHTTRIQVSGNPVQAQIRPLKDAQEGDSTFHVSESMAELKLDIRADKVAAVGATLHWEGPGGAKENRTIAAPLLSDDPLWGLGVHLDLGKEWKRGGVTGEIGFPIYLLPYTTYENGRSTGSDTEGIILPYAALITHADLGGTYPFLGFTLQASARNDGIDHDCVDDWEVEGNECVAPEIREKLVPPVVFGGIEFRPRGRWSVLGSVQYPINDSQLKAGPLFSLGIGLRAWN